MILNTGQKKINMIQITTLHLSRPGQVSIFYCRGLGLAIMIPIIGAFAIVGGVIGYSGMVR